MNELSQLTRQHYEKNETGNSLLSKVTTILDSLPDKPLESSQLAGLDQFHVMGLEATKQLAQIAGIQRGAAVLDAGSGREVHRVISRVPTVAALSVWTFRCRLLP